MRSQALAIVLTLMLPAAASAADVTLTGTYQLDGIQLTEDWIAAYGGENTDAWYENELHLDLLLQQGAFTLGVEFEVVDSNRDQLAGHDIVRNNPGNSEVNNYWIAWKPTDELAFRTGQWPVEWGRAIAFYAQGGYNLSVTYSFDLVEVGLLVGKLEEGNHADYLDTSTWSWVYDKDADRDQFMLTAAFKVAPFTRLDAVVLLDQTQADGIGLLEDTSFTFVGLDLAVPAGPVDLALEYGAFNGSDLDPYGGNYLYLEAGFSRLLPFDLTLSCLRGSEDLYLGYGEDFAPLEVVFNTYPNNAPRNYQAIWLEGRHPLTEKLTLGWALLPYLAAVKADADLEGDGWLDTWHYDGNLGLEADLSLTWKIAGNITYEAAAGYFDVSNGARDDLYTYDVGGFTYYSYGPFYGLDSVLSLWNRISFTF